MKQGRRKKGLHVFVAGVADGIYVNRPGPSRRLLQQGRARAGQAGIPGPEDEPSVSIAPRSSPIIGIPSETPTDKTLTTSSSVLQLRLHLPELLQPRPRRRQEPRHPAAVDRFHRRRHPGGGPPARPEHLDRPGCGRWRPARRGSRLLHRGRDHRSLQANWIPRRDGAPPLDGFHAG